MVKKTLKEEASVYEQQYLVTIEWGEQSKAQELVWRLDGSLTPAAV